MSPIACPNCGREVSQSADHCPHCGTAIPARDHSQETILVSPTIAPSEPTITSAPTTAIHAASTVNPGSTSQSAPFATQSSSPDITHTIELAHSVKNLSLKCLAVCSVILIIVAIYISRPVQDPPMLPAGVAAMISADGTLVTPSGTDAASQTANPAAAAQTDASAYLAYLQKIDQQRVAVAGGFNQALTAAAAAIGTPASPAQDYSQSAQGVLRDFLTEKPPAVCSDLANSYFRLLQDEAGVVDKGMSFWHTGDMKSAASNRDSSASQIASDAAAADSSLTDLCAQQHLDKPFTIQPSIVAGSPSTPAGAAPAAPVASTTPSPTSQAPATTSPPPASTITPGQTSSPAPTPGNAPVSNP